MRGFSLIVAYADSIEPGSYRGEVVNSPQALDANAAQGVRMGARIALNASPLPVVVTAQKPSDVGACWGFAFGQSPKRAAIIPQTPATRSKKGHIARHNAEK